MSPGEFLNCTSSRQAHIVQYGGLDGRVDRDYGGLIKLGLMGVGAGLCMYDVVVKW